MGILLVTGLRAQPRLFKSWPKTNRKPCRTINKCNYFLIVFIYLFYFSTNSINKSTILPIILCYTVDLSNKCCSHRTGIFHVFTLCERKRYRFIDLYYHPPPTPPTTNPHRKYSQYIFFSPLTLRMVEHSARPKLFSAMTLYSPMSLGPTRRINMVQTPQVLEM